MKIKVFMQNMMSMLVMVGLVHNFYVTQKLVKRSMLIVPRLLESETTLCSYTCILRNKESHQNNQKKKIHT